MESTDLRVLFFIFAWLWAGAPPGAALLPELPGTYPTGTWTADWLDEADPAGRELVITAWYPAAPAGGKPARYAPPAAGHDGVRAISLRNAPIARSHAPWPLLLLAPGRGMPGFAYTLLGEALASHGFVVVTVDSPGSGRQYFADGRVVAPDPALAPPPGLMAGPYEAVDRFFADAAERGAADLMRVLDAIARGDASMPFAAHVDTARVGAVGHSLGGRIAGAAAAHDGRIVAWAGVEGLVPRAPRRQGMGIPALVILSDGVWPYAIGNVRELAWCSRHPTYFLRVPNSGHSTIADTVTADGIVRAADGHAQLVEIIRNFFEHHLDDGIRAIEAWPEDVQVETHMAPSGEHPPGMTCND